MADTPRPVRPLSGDELRKLSAEEVLMRARGARTIALGATGFGQLVDRCAAPDGVRVVLDRLDVAVELCRATDADDQP